MLLSEAQNSFKKLLCNNFCWIVLLSASGQKVYQIFKIQFHCVKSVQIQSFFCSVFSQIGLKFLGKYGPEITPYLDIFHAMFLTGDINIFVSRCVSSVLQFQIKSSFSSEETTCGRQAVKV